MEIEFCDLKKQYTKLKDKIDAGIKEVLEHGKFISGPEINELEKKCSDFLKVKNAIAVSSGTDALLLALLALGVKKEDYIITTPFTFAATAEVISFLGAVPLFVDIDSSDCNISPEKVKQLLEKTKIEKTKIKGIIAVDLFGQPANYSELKSICEKNNLFIIEDGAQAFGAKQGDKMACTFGDISITSFFPAKPFGCYGDGGMVFTDNDFYAEKIRMLRNHGQDRKYSHKSIGMNARMDTLQAAILLAKFEDFKDEIPSREGVAEEYRKNLLKVKLLDIKSENKPVFAQFCIIVDNRDKLIDHLSKSKIPTAIHYPKPLHLQEAFSYLGYKEGDFPVAEEIAKKILSLPFDAYKTKNEVQFICKEIKDFIP
jgi:UDP-2-acetamido-2-deoxy-ribo-hexuluronate aminotransferase